MEFPRWRKPSQIRYRNEGIVTKTPPFAFITRLFTRAMSKSYFCRYLHLLVYILELDHTRCAAGSEKSGEQRIKSYYSQSFMRSQSDQLRNVDFVTHMFYLPLVSLSRSNFYGIWGLQRGSSNSRNMLHAKRRGQMQGSEDVAILLQRRIGKNMKASTKDYVLS